MMFTAYVLRSKESGKIYVGITNNLQRRLMEHLSGKSKTGHILGDYDLVFTEK